MFFCPGKGFQDSWALKPYKRIIVAGKNIRIGDRHGFSLEPLNPGTLGAFLFITGRDG